MILKSHAQPFWRVLKKKKILNDEKVSRIVIPKTYYIQQRKKSFLFFM